MKFPIGSRVRISKLSKFLRDSGYSTLHGEVKKYDESINSYLVSWDGRGDSLVPGSELTPVKEGNVPEEDGLYFVKSLDDGEWYIGRLVTLISGVRYVYSNQSKKVGVKNIKEWGIRVMTGPLYLSFEVVEDGKLVIIDTDDGSMETAAMDFVRRYSDYVGESHTVTVDGNDFLVSVELKVEPL